MKNLQYNLIFSLQALRQMLFVNCWALPSGLQDVAKHPKWPFLCRYLLSLAGFKSVLVLIRRLSGRTWIVRMLSLLGRVLCLLFILLLCPEFFGLLYVPWLLTLIFVRFLSGFDLFFRGFLLKRQICLAVLYGCIRILSILVINF